MSKLAKNAACASASSFDSFSSAASSSLAFSSISFSASSTVKPASKRFSYSAFWASVRFLNSSINPWIWFCNSGSSFALSKYSFNSLAFSH